MIINLPGELFTYPWVLYLIPVLILLSVVEVFQLGARRKKTAAVTSGMQIADESYEEALRIIDEARMKSLHILSDSQLRAQRVVDDMKYVSAEAKDDLLQHIRQIYEKQYRSFDTIGNELVDVYKQTLEKEKTQSVSMIQNATSKLRSEILSHIEEYGDIMKKDTFASKEIVEKKIQDKYKAIDEELEGYKADKVRKINDELVKIVADVCSEVFKHPINMTANEALILDAFQDKLRKAGFIHAGKLDKKA